MKSKIIQQDHDHLVELNKQMKPEERLLAFYEHSKLMSEMFEEGIKFRSQNSIPSKKSSSQ